MKIDIEALIIWIVGIIFMCGIVYSNVIKIPAIEKNQHELEIRQSVTETNYEYIKEALVRIETKIGG